MKNTMTWLLAVCLIFTGTFVMAADVPSVNAVGYQTVNVAPKLNMMSLNWNGIGGTNKISVQELMDISNLKKGTSPSTADNLILWDKSTQKYTTLYLYDWATSYWDGKWVSGGKIATNMISVGDGMWLKNTSGSDVTIQISGQVPNGSNTLHVFPGNRKITMFGSAYSADRAVNEMGLTNGVKGTSPSTADNLILWDKSTQKYTTLYLYDWATSYWDGKWVTGGKISTNVLGMGEGAWYKRFTGSGDLNWYESRPYSLE